MKEHAGKTIYKRILSPLDGSTSSEGVLPHVLGIAQEMDTEIIFLHVIPSPAPEFAGPPRPFAKDYVHDQKRKLTRYLKSLCAKLEKENTRVTYLIREGAVPETILEVAEIMQADMIAMTTQGRSAAQILLLGSVTYQVVRHSPLPMLVIRS